MKKIFIAFSIVLLSSCTYYTNDDYPFGKQDSWYNQPFERDSSKYWLNNVRSFKTYPINYYPENCDDKEAKFAGSQTLNTHTYQHNTIVSANTGQRMVDSQTYTVNHYSRESLVLDEDGTIENINYNIKFKEGQEIHPLGDVKINGHYYLVLEPNKDGLIVLLDESGHFVDRIDQLYKKDLLVSQESALITPHNLHVSPKTNSKDISSKPTVQFELKYDGINGNYLVFNYMDYNSAAATQGYFQRYEFPKEQELININGVKFKVMDAYPDRIEYILLD